MVGCLDCNPITTHVLSSRKGLLLPKSIGMGARQSNGLNIDQPNCYTGGDRVEVDIEDFGISGYHTASLLVQQDLGCCGEAKLPCSDGYFSG